MNGVIALCHFCEIHGPSVLFCTQAFHGTDDDSVEKCTGSLKDVNVSSRRSSQSSSSDGSNSSSKSSQPKSLILSLSCEICPGREGPIFFGEDANGYVLSHTFFLKDSQARGLQRWYSIIIVMMDRIYLINSWSFLVKHFKEIIDKLQKMAVEVFSSEQAARFERSGRVNNKSRFMASDVLRRQHRASFRAIQDLTKDKHLFHYLHLYFSWILKAGAHRVTEKVLEGPPREELLTDYEAQQADEPVVAVNTNKKLDEAISDEKKVDCPVFTTLREMLQVLGPAKFHLLAFNVVQGNQLIVRGQPQELVLSIFETLKILIPNRCFKCVPYSDIYKESWTCNFLGLMSDTKIPTHILESHLYTIMDIKEQVSPLEQTSNNPLKRYSFEIRGKDLVHGPQILKKIEEALLNKHFSDSVLDQYLCALKEEWMDKVKVIFKFSRSGPRTSEEKERLFKVLDAKPEDEIILKFWMTGFNKEYRSHLLTCSQATS